jgi:tripartite-type tricarboxylate transporter receptor subunit TctC
LHDAFKKAFDDPKHLQLLAQLSQDMGYLNSEDYTKWVRDNFAREKVLIDRLGLGAK